MHICYVLWKFKSPSFFTQMGGAERQLLNLLKEFRKNDDIHVTVLTKMTKGDQRLEEFSKNIKIIRMPVTRIKFISLFFFTMILPFFICKINKKRKINLFHVPLCDIFLSSLFIMSKITKIPLISRIAGDELDPYRKRGLWLINRKLVLYFIKKSDIVHVLTDYAYKQALKLDINPKNLFNIPNGVIVPTEGKNYERLTKEILYVGAMRYFRKKTSIEQKNLKFLIRSFKLATNTINDLKLVMVGDGNYRSELERYAENLKINNKIIFTGYQTDIKSYMLSGDIFINPSHYEGMPNTVIEAMSYGVLALCSNIPEHAYIINNGKNGILFDRFSEKQLANKIIQFYENPEEMIKIAKKGRKYVKEDLSMLKIANEILEMYSFVTAF